MEVAPTHSSETYDTSQRRQGKILYSGSSQLCEEVKRAYHSVDLNVLDGGEAAFFTFSKPLNKFMRFFFFSRFVTDERRCSMAQHHILKNLYVHRSSHRWYIHFTHSWPCTNFIYTVGSYMQDAVVVVISLECCWMLPFRFRLLDRTAGCS